MTKTKETTIELKVDDWTLTDIQLVRDMYAELAEKKRAVLFEQKTLMALSEQTTEDADIDLAKIGSQIVVQEDLMVQALEKKQWERIGEQCKFVIK